MTTSVHIAVSGNKQVCVTTPTGQTRMQPGAHHTFLVHGEGEVSVREVHGFLTEPSLPLVRPYAPEEGDTADEDRAQSDKPAKVEMVTNGVHKLLFINGQRINRVMDIELPVKAGEVSPQIVVKLWADEIIQRRVEGAEYKRLAGA